MTRTSISTLLALLMFTGCVAESDSDHEDGEEDLDDEGKADAAGSTAAVYFYLADEVPNVAPRCFTGSITKASTMLQNQHHEGATNFTAKVKGTKLEVKYRYFGQPYSHLLPRCPFTMTDVATQVQCTIKISGGEELIPQTLDTGYQKPLDIQWRALSPASKVIDCGTGHYRNVTNTWKQTLSRADIKTAKAMLTADHDLVTGCPTIKLSTQPGLEREQRWSGKMTPELHQPNMCAEIFDASVFQMSVDAERKAWVHDVGDWKPWNLRFVSLECDGFPKMINPAYKAQGDLDMSSPVVKSYCASL